MYGFCFVIVVVAVVNSEQFSSFHSHSPSEKFPQSPLLHARIRKLIKKVEILVNLQGKSHSATRIERGKIQNMSEFSTSIGPANW